MAKKIAFMSIKTQYENLGDAFIIASLLQLMSERAEVVVDASRCPEIFIQSIKQALVDDVTFMKQKGAGFSFFFQLFYSKFLGKDVYYFMVPGGFSGEKSVKGAVFGHIYNFLLFLMKKRGIKAVQVGMSYESLGPRYLLLLKKRAKSFHCHSPRDSLSINYLTEHKLSHNGVIPDLAFNSLPIESKFRSKDTSSKTVFFSFRVDKSLINQQLIKNHIKQAIRVIGSDAKFVFISQVERDNEFTMECFNTFKDSGVDCELLINNTNIISILSRYQECSHVFSNRLHCLLLAARYGASTVPVLNANANFKIQGIWKDIGHAKNIYYLNPEDKENSDLESALNDSTIDFTEHKKALIAGFDNIFFRN